MTLAVLMLQRCWRYIFKVKGHLGLDNLFVDLLPNLIQTLKVPT